MMHSAGQLDQARVTATMPNQNLGSILGALPHAHMHTIGALQLRLGPSTCDAGGQGSGEGVGSEQLMFSVVLSLAHLDPPINSVHCDYT